MVFFCLFAVLFFKEKDFSPPPRPHLLVVAEIQLADNSLWLVVFCSAGDQVGGDI